MGNALGFIVLFTVSIGTALVVYVLVRRSLNTLLDEVVKLPSGTTFYLRLFMISLVFIAASSVLDTRFALEADAAFMEYVWRVAGGVATVFGMTCLFLLGYLVLITILITVLRPRND